jgi:hypothetical protein
MSNSRLADLNLRAIQNRPGYHPAVPFILSVLFILDLLAMNHWANILTETGESPSYPKDLLSDGEARGPGPPNCLRGE